MKKHFFYLTFCMIFMSCGTAPKDPDSSAGNSGGNGSNSSLDGSRNSEGGGDGEKGATGEGKNTSEGNSTGEGSANNPNPKPSAPKKVCSASSYRCLGNTLQRCVNNKWQYKTNCNNCKYTGSGTGRKYNTSCKVKGSLAGCYYGSTRKCR